MKKKTYNPMTAMCAICAVLFIAGLCSQAAIADENVWGDKKGKKQSERKMSAEHIEGILRHIAESNPEKAEYLRQLKKKDPQKFRAQMRQLAGARGDRDGKQPKNRTAGHRSGQGKGQTGKEKTSGIHPSGRGGGFSRHMAKRHDEYVKWFKEEFPEKAQRMEAMREKYPEKYMRLMQGGQKKYSPIMKAQKNNPQLAKVLKEDILLQSQRDQLLRELRSADKEESKALKEELKEIVSSRFDIIVRKKQLNYEDMLKRLQALEKRVNKQQIEVESLKDKKNKTIEQRIEELVGKTEKISWD
jgi:hypothetical protein